MTKLKLNLYLLTYALCSCSQNTALLGQNQNQKEERHKAGDDQSRAEQPSYDREADGGAPQSLEPDPSVLADEPVPIGGTYLACQWGEKAEQTWHTLCRIEGQELDPDGIHVHAEDLDTEKALAMTEMPSDSDWQWDIKIPIENTTTGGFQFWLTFGDTDPGASTPDEWTFKIKYDQVRDDQVVRVAGEQSTAPASETSQPVSAQDPNQSSSLIAFHQPQEGEAIETTTGRCLRTLSQIIGGGFFAGLDNNCDQKVLESGPQEYKMVANNHCLDVRGRAYIKGNDVIFYPCKGGDNQKFDWRVIGSQRYLAPTKSPHLCVGVRPDTQQLELQNCPTGNGS